MTPKTGMVGLIDGELKIYDGKGWVSMNNRTGAWMACATQRRGVVSDLEKDPESEPEPDFMDLFRSFKQHQ